MDRVICPSLHNPEMHRGDKKTRNDSDHGADIGIPPLAFPLVATLRRGNVYLLDFALRTGIQVLISTFSLRVPMEA